MRLDPQQIRIDGVYAQRQPGTFMLRVKVPAGILSAQQAEAVAGIADRFAGGLLHLTTRGSIELHGLAEDQLSPVWRDLAAVGLTTRGACGGAVRGVVCGSVTAGAWPLVQALAHKLHLHFTRNPHFEGLPKKFKIGVFTGDNEGRHLIQDLSLVHREDEEGSPRFDVWAAGGLGREPSPAFLVEEAVAEERIIPLIEAVVRVYKERTPKGKRLKHLVRQVGRDDFLALVAERRVDQPLPLADSFSGHIFPSVAVGGACVEAPVFAGELTSDGLRSLAHVARDFAAGFLVLTGDQNVRFLLPEATSRQAALDALSAAGFDATRPEQRVSFRICPGSHECAMGLAPTRDMARAVIEAMGDDAAALRWSISGCPNSCSQPQLAQAGIVTVKSVKEDDGQRRPLFDIYRREENDGLGTVVRSGINLEELMAYVRLERPTSA